MDSPNLEDPSDATAAYVRKRGKPVPDYLHSWVQANAIASLCRIPDITVFSELNLELDGWRTVPDLSVYRGVRPLLLNDIEWMTESPLMAVEIMVPSQSVADVMDRVNGLLRAGVPSVWLVVPAVRVVSIFQKDYPPLSALHGNLTDPATGITVDVGELFA